MSEKDIVNILDKSIDEAYFELEKEYDDEVIPMEEIKDRITVIFKRKLNDYLKLENKVVLFYEGNEE